VGSPAPASIIGIASHRPVAVPDKNVTHASGLVNLKPVCGARAAADLVAAGCG